MKIYFIRHGQPNYELDCLTELGHKQASAAAERLKDCKIERIFASPNGRAFQTAEHTAKLLGLDIETCEFMREINGNLKTGDPDFKDGFIWDMTKKYPSFKGSESIPEWGWQMDPAFINTSLPQEHRTVVDGADGWLAELGYKREGDYYRVVGDGTDKTVAMFSHAGSSSVVIAHILGIPFLRFAAHFEVHLASVSCVEFSDNSGELICPQLTLFNDSRHTEGINA